jgi:hypothetical protein
MEVPQRVFPFRPPSLFKIVRQTPSVRSGVRPARRMGLCSPPVSSPLEELVGRKLLGRIGAMGVPEHEAAARRNMRSARFSGFCNAFTQPQR